MALALTQTTTVGTGWVQLVGTRDPGAVITIVRVDPATDEPVTSDGQALDSDGNPITSIPDPT